MDTLSCQHAAVRTAATRSAGGICRSRICLLLAACLAAGCWSGSGPTNGQFDKTFGRVGISDGRFEIPRAIAINEKDELFIVDKTGRIQVFTTEGEFLRGWQTPRIEAGKPSGLSFDHEGNLLVADTHYFRMLVYTPAGDLLNERTLGGKYGVGEGELEFVTHAVIDRHGNYFLTQYGECDRIQKFTPDGKVLMQIGRHGSAPGEFIRPQKLTFDAAGLLWVADACNHRVQVFDVSGSEARLVKIWGEQGSSPGQLSYPYDLVLDGHGHVYLSEWGNHRVQKFTLDGVSLGCFGRSGREPGELANPWGIARDSRGRMYVLDTNNHRVQRFRL